MKLPHMYLICGRQCVNTKISSLICEVDLFVELTTITVTATFFFTL